MNTVYLDNFRGFSDTYINLEKVNFFVGENSTGKSSVISIIKLLSSSEFWFNNSFNYLDQINFTHFQDIVSVHALNQKYFNIGHMHSNDNDDISAFFISFKSVKGLPKPEVFYYYHNGEEVKIRLSTNGGKFKIKETVVCKSVEECKNNIFKNWIENYLSDTTGYKKFPYEAHTLPLKILIEYVRISSPKKTKSNVPRLTQLFFTDNIVWMAPIRTIPKRTYDEYKYDFSPDGSHTPYVIKQYLDKKSEAEKFKTFLEEIGKDSKLFKSINITKFGRKDTAPFEVDIILDEKKLGINNVGYGVSQVLPVLVESFVRPDESWFAIQQPEVHLHPKAQASLGDMFYKLSVKENKNFIVETHSDYTIDRFRINCKKDKQLKNISAQIIYFERMDSKNTVHHLPIDKKGNLPSNQPKSYRDFFVKEELSLLGY